MVGGGSVWGWIRRGESGPTGGDIPSGSSRTSSVLQDGEGGYMQR